MDGPLVNLIELSKILSFKKFTQGFVQFVVKKIFKYP